MHPVIRVLILLWLVFWLLIGALYPPHGDIGLGLLFGSIGFIGSMLFFLFMRSLGKDLFS